MKRVPVDDDALAKLAAMLADVKADKPVDLTQAVALAMSVLTPIFETKPAPFLFVHAVDAQSLGFASNTSTKLAVKMMFVMVRMMLDAGSLTDEELESIERELGMDDGEAEETAKLPVLTTHAREPGKA